MKKTIRGVVAAAIVGLCTAGNVTIASSSLPERAAKPIAAVVCEPVTPAAIGRAYLGTAGGLAAAPLHLGPEVFDQVQACC